MKKKLIFLLFLLLTGLTSCDNEYNMEYTSAKMMGGEWYVTIDAEPGSGFHLFTSNTAGDTAGKLLISDNVKFYGFAAVANNDLANLTFSTPAAGVLSKLIEALVNVDFNGDKKKDHFAYEITVKITNGKITPKSVKLPSGVMADKIELTIAFSDDNPAYKEYKLLGYRITGFDEDVDFEYNTTPVN